MRTRPVILRALASLFMAAPAWAQTPGLPGTEQAKVLNLPWVARNQLVIHPGNPQVMYWAMASLGVLKSTDGGLTWVPKNNGLPVLSTRSIAIDPTNPDHLMVGFDGHYYAQGGPPYRSVDGGERWEPTVTCEREDGIENLRQQSSAERLLFDPTEPDRFYFLVHSQYLSCGGFYRSCDKGASYDRNPRCIATPEPRPACASGEPEPVNNITSNDASILEVHGGTGDLFGTTGVHPDECALMTSRDKGGAWTWEDVVDTTGTFVDPALQGPSGLFVYSVELAPSQPDVRYAGVAPYSTRCADGKAYPQMWQCPFSSWTSQANVVVRWFGEMSGGVECEGNNDCDGDPAPDRVWRPIMAPRNNISWILDLLVHPADPNRVFVLGTGSPSEVLMLTPANPGNLSVVPWQTTVLYSEDTYLDALVADPGNPDRFYLVGDHRIHRFESADGWLTWTRTVVADANEFFHVYDLVETRGSDGHRVVAATTSGLSVLDELGAVTFSDSNIIQAVAPAVSPTDPDRVFVKRSWAVQIGTTGFDSVVDMDDVHKRREVMCTNIFHDLAVDPDDPAVLYAATGAGIRRQPNAHVPVDPADTDATSRAWESFARAADGLADEYVWSVAFDPADASHDTMLAGTRGSGIFESSDRGNNWSAAPLDLPPPLGGSAPDVKDFQFQGSRAWAATRAGVLVRSAAGSPWTLALGSDPVSRVAVGASGTRRAYAAGEAALHRTRDAGGSFESLPLVPRPPYSAVLETTSRDGRHHLWVPDWRAGLYRISTTMTARPGADQSSVVLDWTEPPGQGPAGYRLHYGSDPDTLQGTGAAEGNSPISLGPVRSATLTGLDFHSGTIYVVLQGIGPAAEQGPLGLPLAIEFGYVFSPRWATVSGPSCPLAIRLTWSAIPGATKYRLHRSAVGAGGPFDVQVEIDPAATSYDDTAVVDGTTYWYYATTVFGLEETSGGPIVSARADFDFDNDGVADCSDNCPPGFNPTQADSDGDGTGDACEDPDGDGVEAYRDNCRLVPNPGQADGDGDLVGDACDNCPTVRNRPQLDSDGDGKGNSCDNCPAVANPEQEDQDGDGKGDTCDNCPATSNASQADADADGRGDVCDNCPAVANPGQEDQDGDGKGDACDNCPDTGNASQADADADGRGDVCDNCPAVANPGQEDQDGDGKGDACDNCAGAFNPNQYDCDGDGLGDACGDLCTRTYASRAPLDGQVSRTSANAFSATSFGSIFRTGDAKQQSKQVGYRGVLSFDTGDLPLGAQVMSATLTLIPESVAGQVGPGTSFTVLHVKARRGFFGTFLLEGTDYGAPETGTLAEALPFPTSNADLFPRSVSFASGELPWIDVGPGGVTQIRLQFGAEFDNDNTADQVRWYAGDASGQAPALHLTYTAPGPL